ncbi:hypothetical protein Q3G72_033390 [Acer saccharum]|nr:hypothetical protein Q3G72_033390 [Acer saccharum]
MHAVVYHSEFRSFLGVLGQAQVEFSPRDYNVAADLLAKKGAEGEGDIVECFLFCGFCFSVGVLFWGGLCVGVDLFLLGLLPCQTPATGFVLSAPVAGFAIWSMAGDDDDYGVKKTSTKGTVETNATADGGNRQKRDAVHKVAPPR